MEEEQGHPQPGDVYVMVDAKREVVGVCLVVEREWENVRVLEWRNGRIECVFHEEFFLGVLTRSHMVYMLSFVRVRREEEP